MLDYDSVIGQQAVAEVLFGFGYLLRIHLRLAQAMISSILPPRYPSPVRRPQLLRCPGCDRIQQRPPDTLGRLRPRVWPECCGHLMVPASPADEPGRESDTHEAMSPWSDRRDDDRHEARAGARLELRRDEDNSDAAIALLDVSANGLKVAIRGRLFPGDQVDVVVGPPGGEWECCGQAIVQWCVDGAEGTALVGVRLCRSLTADHLIDLSE